MTKIKITIPEKTDNTIYIEHAKKMINNTVDIILQEACKQITQSVPTQYDTQSIPVAGYGILGKINYLKSLGGGKYYDKTRQIHTRRRGIDD